MQRWQEDVGVHASGSVPLGSMAFVPESATVTTSAATVGSSVADAAGGAGSAIPSSPVLSVASVEWELQFTGATADLDTIALPAEAGAVAQRAC